MENLSTKLNRISACADNLRAKVGEINTPLQELGVKTQVIIDERNATLMEKDNEIAALSEEMDALRVSSADQVAVLRPENNTLCSALIAGGENPSDTNYVESFIFKRVWDFKKPALEWCSEFCEKYNLDPESYTYYNLIVRSDSNNHYLRIMFRPEGSDRYSISVQARDNVTGSYVQIGATIYSSTGSRTELPVSIRVYDAETGTSTTITDPKYKYIFAEPVKIVANTFGEYPAELVDLIGSFFELEFDGTYLYNNEEWERLPEGYNLEPENVVKGVSFKTDEGEKVGTLGANVLTDMDDLAKVGTVFETQNNGVLNVSFPSGSYPAAQLFQQLHTGTDDEVSPMFNMINWRSTSNFDSFLSGSYGGVNPFDFDLRKYPKDILGQPTSMRYFLASTKARNVHLGDLDTSKLKDCAFMFNGIIDYNSIKEELVAPRTFSLVGGNGGQSGCGYMMVTKFTGITDDTVVKIANKRFTHATTARSILVPTTAAGGPKLNILLENIVFDQTLAGLEFYTSAANDRPYSICFRNVDMHFVECSTTQEKSRAFRYVWGANHSSNTPYNKLKYIIFDIDYVFNTHQNWSNGTDDHPGLTYQPLWTQSDGAIYVRDNMVSAYKNSTYWNYFASKIKPISEMCDEMKRLYGYGEEV